VLLLSLSGQQCPPREAARDHHYEVASAAFQIGIVLASATIITA
jgi:hypothetical protein